MQSENTPTNSEKKKSDEILKQLEEVDVSQLVPTVRRGIQNHRWIQRGPNIICESCETTHGTFIGNDHVLTGIDEEGKPILAKRFLRG